MEFKPLSFGLFVAGTAFFWSSLPASADPSHEITIASNIEISSSAAPVPAGTPDEPTVSISISLTAPAKTLSLTSPTVRQAAKQKKEVAGGFTLIDAKHLEEGRGSNIQDLLGSVPGLTLQSDNGMEASKVSIRGSGILSEDEPLGVAFLLDGFPLNQGDGEVILEDLSVGAIDYAEVFRGANAFKYGALTLGGSVNLVTRTGYTADPLQIRAEGGSYGFLREQTSSGGTSGPMDYYVSATARTRDGYREHSKENTKDLFSDFGYKINAHLENRVYLTVTRTNRELPGGLTKDQMNQDPRQANPPSLDQNLGKEWYYVRLADKVSFKSEHEQADAGIYWWHRDLLDRGLFNAESPEGILDYHSDNFGLLLNSVSRGQYFGHLNILTGGFAPTVEREVDQNYENLSGQKGTTTAHDTEVSINTPLYIEDQQYLTEKLSFLAGLQAIYAERRFRDLFIDTPSGDPSANLVAKTLNPKVGTLYAFNGANQVYANLSRSWQPPSFDNMVNFGDTPGDSLMFMPLAPQRAWTAEVGTRGEAGRFGWELSLYHSWVRNELLDLNNAQGVDLGAVNIDRSTHQGIEAGLEIELLDSVFIRRHSERDGDRLTLNQTYTLNDFHFDGDPVYGNNRIGGIPIHLYQAEVMYKHPCGVYAGPNIQWNMASYPVDHANTLFADTYALPGFKMGFASKKGFSVFFEAKNLTDTHYASSVDPIPDARTVMGPIQTFHPGDGRSFYGGISWVL